MKLPTEIMNQIFQWSSTSETFHKDENSSRGYLINKYFTQQFFQNELKDINFNTNKRENKGILQHSEMVKTLNCDYYEHEFYEILSLPICFSNCSVLKCELTSKLFSNHIVALFPNVQTLVCTLPADFEILQFIKYWTSLSTVHLIIEAGPIIDPFNTIIETVTSLEIFGFSRICQSFINQLFKCFPNCSQLKINHFNTVDDLDLSTFDKLDDITIVGMETIILPKRLKKLRLSLYENSKAVFPDSITDYCEIIMDNRTNEQLVDMLPIIRKALKYAIFYEKSLFDYSDNYDVVISNFVYPIWPSNKYKQIGNEYICCSMCDYKEDFDAFGCHGEAVASFIRELTHDNRLRRQLGFESL